MVIKIKDVIMKKQSIKIITALLCLAVVSAGCKNKSGKNESFSFAFITDIHLQPERNGLNGFLKAIDTLNDRNPDFVITGGDLIFDALRQSHGRADSLYDLYHKTIKSLKMPVYNTMGNHEIYGIYKKSSGADPNHPYYGEKMFYNHFGDSYYSFDHNEWKFMIINSVEDTGKDSYIGLIDTVQIGWIKSELEKTNPVTPIVISTHIPFITAFTQKYEGTTMASDSNRVVINGKEVLDMFKGYNLKLVLQGHLHTIEDIYIDGIHFITGGAVSGSWWKGPHRGSEEGFVLIKVKGNEFEWEYVDYRWIVNNSL